MTYWDDAAAEAYDTIAAHVTSKNNLDQLRYRLDTAIDIMFGSEIRQVLWAEIGKIAMNVAGPDGPSRDAILTTVVSKQRDYGTNNILRFGNDGLLVRVHDKVARLENLLGYRAGEAANETVADTYLDIIGYSIIAIMLTRDEFTLPLRKDVTT